MKKKVLNIVLILLISFIFIDIVCAEPYNNYTSATVSCGDGILTDIPTLFPKVVSIIYTVMQIAIPVVLVIMGSLDLMKGITAGKEDEMKKGQQMFVKRLVVAVLIFVVVVIVKFLISVIADSTDNIVECIDCFLSGTDNCRR